VVQRQLDRNQARDRNHDVRGRADRALGRRTAVHTARTEKGFPILACIQIICADVVTFTIVLFTLVWAVASFRVGEVSAEITQVLNDTAYFFAAV
jgi:hypothetical protein